MRLAGLLALAAALCVPSTAHGAAPWRSALIESGRTAVALAVDAGPGVPVATVLERRDGGRRVLELREPAGVRTLAVSERGGFSDVLVDHDDRGRRTVAWSAVPAAGGPRRLFVSEAGAPARRLTGDGGGVVDERASSLDVAGGGQAVLTLAPLSGGDSVAYRGAGGTFGVPVALEGGQSQAAIAEDGTATLVSESLVDDGRQRLEYRRIGPDGVLGPATVADVGGRDVDTFLMRLAVARDGRAVAAWIRERSQDADEEVFGDDRVVESRAQTWTWAPGAQAPGLPRLTSPRGDFAEEPRVAPAGGGVTVAWVRRGRADATSRSRRVGARGLGPVRSRRLPVTGFQKYEAAPVLAPGDVLLYPARGVWFTLDLSAARRPARRVTPAGDDVRTLFAASTGTRIVALWGTAAGVRLGREP